MFLSLFQNINALSMFVIITVIGISIYTILTYKSLILFEKDIYRMKSQISAIGSAVQDLLQKEKGMKTYSQQNPQNQNGKGKEKEKEKEVGGQQFNQTPSNNHIDNNTHVDSLNYTNPIACPIHHDSGMPGVPSMSESVKRSRNEEEEEEEEEEEDGKIEEFDETDDDVSKEEIAKLKNLIANMKSDDEDEDQEKKESDEDKLDQEEDEISLTGLQVVSDSSAAEKVDETLEVPGVPGAPKSQKQEESIETFIQGHQIDEDDKEVVFATPEELQVMKYEDLRQYLRSHFGISQSRGTKADLIKKIKEQIENSIV